MSRECLQINNAAVEILFEKASGTLSFVDRATNTMWGSDPWLNSPGSLTLEQPSGKKEIIDLRYSSAIDARAEGENALRIIYSNNEPAYTVDVRLSLIEGGFRIEILAVTYPADWRFVDLEYPARVGAFRTDVDQGYLVIPFWQGSIVPCTTGAFDRIPRVPFWAWDDMPWRDPATADLAVYDWSGVSMPFFGAVRDGSAWVAIFETENDAAVRGIFNANLQSKYDHTGQVTPFTERLAVSSPLWRSEKGEFAYARSISYYMIPGGDYVAVAKRYRQHAQASGLAISLKDKIQNNPNIGEIIGAPLINVNGGYPWYIDYPAFRFTWNDVNQMVDDIRTQSDLQRALLCLWIGYQNYPPDSYPFHPANGTVEELQSMVKRSREKDFLVCFYHGYPALLDHAENFDINRARRINRNGELHSRWGRHCSAFFLEYAKKNLPLSIRDSGQVADYTDMLTAGGLAECWGEGHDMTRSLDRRHKEELLQYINSLGLFTGSENARGWAVPLMAYAKNAGMGGNHSILNCHAVPLFNMVFKDSIVMYREHQAIADSSVFADFAIGNHIQLHMTWPSYRTHLRENADVVRLFCPFNRATGTEELLSHHFVDEFNGPYITRFSNGAEVRVNPAESEREVAGEVLQSGALSVSDGKGTKTLVAGAKRALSFHTSND